MPVCLNGQQQVLDRIQLPHLSPLHGIAIRARALTFPHHDLEGMKMEVPLHEIQRRFPANHLDSLLEILRGPGFQVLRALQQTLGAEVYLVGGIIRDSIIGSQPKDFDFVVRFSSAEGSADPATWVRRFEDFFGARRQEGWNKQAVIQGSYGRLVLAGTRFGVYKFTPQGSAEEIDIAFPRTDHAPEGTLGSARDIIAQSDPCMPFARDVLRRDFTINGGALALAWDAEGHLAATFLDYAGYWTIWSMRPCGPSAIHATGSMKAWIASCEPYVSSRRDFGWTTALHLPSVKRLQGTESILTPAPSGDAGLRAGLW